MSRAKSDKIYTVPPNVELRILEFIWEVEAASTRHIQRMVEAEKLCGETIMRRALANIHKKQYAHVEKTFTGHTTKGSKGTGETYTYRIIENTNIRIQELKTEIEKRKTETLKAEMYGSKRFYLHSVENSVFIFRDREGILYKPLHRFLHGYLDQHSYGFKFCTIFTHSLYKNGKVILFDGDHVNTTKTERKWIFFDVVTLRESPGYVLHIHPENLAPVNDQPMTN